MKRILSLDISSSTIGWSVFNISFKNKEIILVDYGNIKPPSKKKAESLSLGISYRLSKISEFTKDLLERHNPDIIVSEDYARKFAAGRSSANTIMILATVNEVVALESFRHSGAEVFRMPVSKIRKILRDQYNSQAKDKEDILNLMLDIFNNFKIKKNRSGNIKKECFDEADAMAVGVSFFHMELEKNVKNHNK